MRSHLRFLLLLALLCGAALGQMRSRQKPTGAPGSDLDILTTAVATFDGTLRTLSKKQVLIEMGEEQTLTIEVNKKTRFLRGDQAIAMKDFAAGAIVTVDAKKVANQLVAVAVRLKDPPRQP